MKKLIIFLIALSATPALTAFSAEVDQFTRRDEELADSSDLLNLKANQVIAKTIAKLNQDNGGCREDLLYSELKNYFGNHLSGEFTKDLIENDNFSKREISIGESIYQDWTVLDGALLSIPILQKFGQSLSSMVRVGDIVIGTDKFEHLFGRGYKYFVKNYKKEKGVGKALRLGIIGEKFILGGHRAETGVFSYGDLSANFNGMRFWNHILLRNDDILGREYNVGPFIVCSNNHWEKAKDVDFKNYVDSAWDEGINCSKFSNQRAVNKFTKRISALGLSCPVDPEVVKELAVKYGTLSKWLINSEGNGVLKITKEFKSK